MAQVRLITLNPGHFHAALIQKEMYPEVSPRVAVYAPLGADLIEHLNRIARFNARNESPTSWELDIHTGADSVDRMLRDKPGDVVVMSGRNREKIDAIRRSVEGGLNVLADKPWIISSSGLPVLDRTLDEAAARGLIAYDIMTERFEVTSILLKALVHDPEVFGEIEPGTEDQPGVYMESVHHIMKLVAGRPNPRPAWFFDIREQGEGISDVGTHLVDLTQWTLFPERAPDYRSEISIDGGQRWPTLISKAQFQQVTGESGFPPYLANAVSGECLEYFCNNQIRYTVRGVHVTLETIWNWEAPAGAGDTHLAIFRGSRARVEIRQGERENYRPELYVVANSGTAKAGVAGAIGNRLAALAGEWPGVACEDEGESFHIRIPDSYRVGHEAHFGQVTRRFFKYLSDPASLPAWEKAAMLAKYFVSTRGVEASATRTTR